MAIFDESLPIRTEVDGDAVVHISDISRGTQTNDVRVTMDGETVTVSATDLDIRPLTNADVVTAEQGTTPWVVSISDATPGTPVHDYQASTAVLAGATSTHTYTVTGGTTLNLKSIIVACSDKFQCEVKTGPVGSPTTKAVVIGNGANPTEELRLAEPIEVAAGNVVELTLTNRHPLSPNDLFSTIVGSEVI